MSESYIESIGSLISSMKGFDKLIVSNVVEAAKPYIPNIYELTFGDVEKLMIGTKKEIRNAAVAVYDTLLQYQKVQAGQY